MLYAICMADNVNNKYSRYFPCEISTSQRLRAHEWNDGLLEIAVDMLFGTEKWRVFESDLNQRPFRVYNLKPQRARIDSSTASGLLDGHSWREKYGRS
jgi:hypothetical protein